MFAKKEKFTLNRLDDDTSLGISMFQNEVIKILRMNPAYRKEEEVQRLIDFLLFFEVFKDMKDLEVLREICRSAEYATVEQGSFVFEQGDQPDYYYILVRGEVSGSVKKVEAPQTKFLDEVDVIFRLGHGRGFGELALIENIPRTASLVATKTSHLMLIPRAEYMRTVRAHHLAVSERNVALLNEIKLFSNFDEAKKRKFTSFCYQHTFPLGTVLFPQGVLVTKFIFIKSGSVHMIRHLTLESISESVRNRYAREIAATTFPIRFLAGSLGNNDYIGVNEFILKDKSHFEYVVSIPCRAIEISTSDFIKQENFIDFLKYDAQKLAAPDDDILIQEYFERQRWQHFQHSFSQKVLCEKKLGKLSQLRASEKLLKGTSFQENQTSEKVQTKLRRFDARVSKYIEEVKTSLPLIANTKNHVALYDILAAQNKEPGPRIGLGINQIYQSNV